jgi:hypothetical protein
MTTLHDAVELTRSYLMTGQQDRLNLLDLDVNSSVDIIQFRDELAGVVANTRIAIDLEEMHVRSVSGSAAGSTATVIRGFNGSTAAAHTNGAIIRVAPQFSSWRIAQEINEELGDLSAPTSGLFRIRPIEFTFTPAQFGYNLTAADMIDIWRVRYDYPGPFKDWPVMDRRDWYLDQDANLTDFPGGKQLVLRRPAFPGHTVRVSYKATFGGPLSAVTDDILAVTGLHTEAHDLLSLGSALSLTMGRDIKRSFMESQPEPRRSSEVGTSAGQIAMRPLLGKYADRIIAEVSRLYQRYPEQL